MKLEMHASVAVPKPPEAVFDFAVADGTLARVLKPLGPIPGVTGSERVGGAPLAAGLRRNVTMTDRSVVEEEVTCHDPPREHSYRWLNRPAPPLSLLVATANTTWTFTGEAGGTRVDWLYTFHLTSPFAYPLTLLVSLIFRRWMQKGLDRLKDALGST